jgi:uncharacterized protein (DUF2236 family)
VADFFPLDSIIRRVNAEPALLLGAGRALLLQLAHPSVAAGVADHSDFQHNPFRRLRGTLEATYTVVFGPADLARAVGRRISWIHDHVTGPTYKANDPDNLLWVHATLLDTALRCHVDLVGPLSDDQIETYYQEMAQVAEVFGCPRSAQPATFGEFAAYFDQMVASIEVSDAGRRLAHDIVWPSLPGRAHVPLAPALSVHRLLAVGTTPEPIRGQLGFTWDSEQQRRLRRVQRRARSVSRITPRAARVAPVHGACRVLIRQAAQHVAEFERRPHFGSVDPPAGVVQRQNISFPS